MYYSNTGDVYKGNWQYNKKHGVWGKLICKTNKVIEGEWENDDFKGLNQSEGRLSQS